MTGAGRILRAEVIDAGAHEEHSVSIGKDLVSFNDEQMRAPTKATAHNLAVLKHITLNLIRLNPVKRKGSIKTRRIIAESSDTYRADRLGLK